MMRTWLIAAAVTLAAIATPARAADIATIGCIAQELPTAARATIVERGRAVAAKQATDEAALKKAQEGLRAALGRCTDRHHWSDAAGQAAVLYTVFDLMLEGSLIATVPEGVTQQKVQAGLDLMPESERAALTEGTGGGVAMAEAFKKTGFNVRSGNQAEMVGNVAGALLNRDKYRALFIAS